jgi:N,N'-diacetylchitobiose phosphorylase
VDQAFARSEAVLGQKKLAVFQCKTPHPGLDTMINTWTLYQAETCVVWSRFASFIEVGGRTGLGYRDTSQDVMSVVHTNPAKCRQRIVELLKAQVSQGYGLHLFDPDWFDPGEAEGPQVQIAHRSRATPDRKSMIHGLKTPARTTRCGWWSRSANT